MAVIEPRQIQWDSAKVEDATLTVALTGSAARAWKARFERVLAMLDTPHSGWGEVRSTKKGIKVADLREGSEPELRHFLESVILQANSDTATAPAPDDDGEENQEPDFDEEMTRTFRAFADESHA